MQLKKYFLIGLFLFLGVLRAQAAVNQVRIWEEGDYRYIQSNGIPDHAAGPFPNAGNPNSISQQNDLFRVPLHPELSRYIFVYRPNLFGVALNGVPFDPGTAEYWEGDRHSGWNYEALSGKINLGLDDHNAHVQPNGAYHYHGIPAGLLNEIESRDGSKQVGYAADGFPIYYSRDAKSSYRIKKGTRPSGPGGRYDGTFVQDYEYVEGLGNLDECNGRFAKTAEYPEGIYQYYLTKTFPFVPRCLKGSIDPSFMKTGPDAGEQEPSGTGGRKGLPARKWRPPEAAIQACAGLKEEASCQFQAPHGTVVGMCRDIQGFTACVPERLQ